MQSQGLAREHGAAGADASTFYAWGVQTVALRPYAAEAQSLVLKLMARSPRLPSRVPLAVPRTMLHTGGTSVAHLYDDVFCHRSYESPTPLPARARIVDAGAHLGMASLFFLSRYCDSTLTAFEPNPNLASLLRKNLAPWSARATVYENALSVRAGKVAFHLTEDNPFNVTGGIENREGPGRAVRVLEVDALDAATTLTQPIDLMKLDVEGHEYQLLPLALFRPDHVANLIIEFHDIDGSGGAFAEVIDLLVAQRGYRVASDQGVRMHLDEVLRLTGSVVLKLY